MKILCSISTRGRYHTTLPLALMSVINQDRLPDKVVVFDDNQEPIDVRSIQVYQYIFMMMDLKKIQWEWVFSEKRGQHFNHDKANKKAVREGFSWVWRMDDDTVAEPDVLSTLLSYVSEEIGAVGGSILTPPLSQEFYSVTGKIKDVFFEPNVQWGYIKAAQEVDHLHCSFIYRAGVCDYDLRLSRIAHREETMFTYSLKRKGYKNLVVPCITWHLKNREGGIRDGANELFQHDESIFHDFLSEDHTIVVLDCGMGDHIVFKHVLPDVKNAIVFSCYPEIIPGRSISEAKNVLGHKFDNYNIYKNMSDWNWNRSLEEAFRKLYVR